MKAAVYSQPGPPEVFRYVDVADPRCPPDGVIIRVEAISIEGGDLINRRLSAPPHDGFVIGYAAAGAVVEIGASVTDRHIGQRLATFDVSGSHAGLRAVSADKTWPVPDDLDIGEAAALPISFGTAHHSLFARGQLSAGEVVLIQAGAGGVGVAAVQLAHRAGARVIATVSGHERAEQLAPLGLDHAIDHRKEDVVSEVMRLTGGQGVDLVLDPVGTTLDASLAALRPEGRLVFVGNAGGGGVKADLWTAMQSNYSLHGVFMGTQLLKPQVQATIAQMLSEAAAGKLKAVVGERFPLAQVATAHGFAESAAKFGRVLMVPG